MASEQNNNGGAQQGEHDKIFVGDLSITISQGAMSRIGEQVGEIMDAQIILRGGQALGYGKVTFNVKGSGATANEGDIQGTARLERADRGEPRAPRGKKARKPAGRARRSADDPDYATTEEAAANGHTSVQAVTKGLGDLSTSDNAENKNARIDNDVSAAGGAVEGAAAETIRNAAGGRGAKAARRGKGARGAAAAKPRVKRERGEPSKTLVYVRNLPFSMTEEKFTEILTSSGVNYQSVSVPVAKFGYNKGKGRGYGFVTVESEEQQTKAIEAIDGKEVTTSGKLADSTTNNDAEKTEGGETKEVRKFKLVARPGYDEPEHHEEDGEAAAAGPNDSGTAENEAVTA